ncbi:NAD-dependent epimerase/dehydratase family protein [bacterium]|nr:MAG: NAD-dependent epimerase/dehydratase family protein [bacterium]
MKILITGVAGFIGSNLADRLIKEGHQVVGIDNLSYGVKEQVPKKVKFHKLDIRSKKIYPLFKNIDFVFHLAAKNCIADCQENPVETSSINVAGTVNVFEASRCSKVKKIIYAESAAIYEGSKTLPTPEYDEKPESFYAISKLSSALFAKAYNHFYGLNFTALRYFCVYGPRQDYRRTIPPVMSAFIIKLLKNEKSIIYGSGKKRRDFIHIDDINDFHLLCIKDAKTDNKVFNLGNGKSYSVLEIYDMVSKILKKNISPVFKKNLPGEAQETLADIRLAQKIGWKPKINIETGIKDMIEYIKEEIKKNNIK